MFFGEQAVDEGGPTREFFCLVLRDVFSRSGLFTGYPDHVVPVHNVEPLENNKFFIVGIMIATSLVQGGESPSSYANTVADTLVFGDVRSAVCLEDIPDYTVRSTLKEVRLLCCITVSL